MVVIVLSKAPAKLRGDLTRWLFEIDTNVYVGSCTYRVREKLWERLGSMIGDGRAIMAYSAKTEQGFELKTYGWDWAIEDLDGLKLLKKRFSEEDEEIEEVSPPIDYQILDNGYPKNYVVIDCETTGLNPSKNLIIELGAVKYIDDQERDRFHAVIKIGQRVPKEISRLTGITDFEVQTYGCNEKETLLKFREFIEWFPLVGHNIEFDISFLQKAFERHQIDMIDNKTIDTLKIAQQELPNLNSYKLIDIGEYLGTVCLEYHRAVEDCLITHFVFVALKNFIADRKRDGFK